MASDSLNSLHISPTPDKWIRKLSTHRFFKCSDKAYQKPAGMTFYPPRKIIGTFGSIFLGLSLFAFYRYNQGHKFSFAIIAVLSLCIAVYQLVPVFRNQIVEIVSDGIIISSFGKKTAISKADLYNVEYHHTCIASYQFNQGKRYYQITPIAYN